MMLKTIMKAEAMFISSLDLDHEISGDPGLGEISGGRVAEPRAFPWYLLIPVLIIHDICRRRRRHCLWTKQIHVEQFCLSCVSRLQIMHVMWSNLPCSQVVVGRAFLLRVG